MFFEGYVYLNKKIIVSSLLLLLLLIFRISFDDFWSELYVNNRFVLLNCRL